MVWVKGEKGAQAIQDTLNAIIEERVTFEELARSAAAICGEIGNFATFIRYWVWRNAIHQAKGC